MTFNSTINQRESTAEIISTSPIQSKKRASLEIDKIELIGINRFEGQPPEMPTEIMTARASRISDLPPKRKKNEEEQRSSAKQEKPRLSSVEESETSLDNVAHSEKGGDAPRTSKPYFKKKKKKVKKPSGDKKEESLSLSLATIKKELTDAQERSRSISTERKLVGSEKTVTIKTTHPPFGKRPSDSGIEYRKTVSRIRAVTPRSAGRPIKKDPKAFVNSLMIRAAKIMEEKGEGKDNELAIQEDLLPLFRPYLAKLEAVHTSLSQIDISEASSEQETALAIYPDRKAIQNVISKLFVLGKKIVYEESNDNLSLKHKVSLARFQMKLRRSVKKKDVACVLYAIFEEKTNTKKFIKILKEICKARKEMLKLLEQKHLISEKNVENPTHHVLPEKLLKSLTRAEGQSKPLHCAFDEVRFTHKKEADASSHNYVRPSAEKTTKQWYQELFKALYDKKHTKHKFSKKEIDEQIDVLFEYKNDVLKTKEERVAELVNIIPGYQILQSLALGEVSSSYAALTLWPFYHTMVEKRGGNKVAIDCKKGKVSAEIRMHEGISKAKVILRMWHDLTLKITFVDNNFERILLGRLMMEIPVITQPTNTFSSFKVGNLIFFKNFSDQQLMHIKLIKEYQQRIRSYVAKQWHGRQALLNDAVIYFGTSLKYRKKIPLLEGPSLKPSDNIKKEIEKDS